MVRIEISAQKNEEKIKIIEILSAKTTVEKISKTYKKGKYFRVYLDVK